MLRYWYVPYDPSYGLLATLAGRIYFNTGIRRRVQVQCSGTGTFHTIHHMDYWRRYYRYHWRTDVRFLPVHHMDTDDQSMEVHVDFRFDI